MKTDLGPQTIQNILQNKKIAKAPAYEWQDLALQIIKELNVPRFKKNSVFKVCRDYPKVTILKALNDTKELRPTGEKWKYFFKILSSPDQSTPTSN